MIILVTFRIPGGYIGALTAFLFSREDLISTTRSAIFFIAAFLIGALFIPVGARLLASTPETHFLWIGCSLFVAFFLLRCLANYGVAIGLALVIANVVGIWYLPGPAARNVELTLWLIAATSIGGLVTLCVEVAFHAVRRRDDLLEGLDSRWHSSRSLWPVTPMAVRFRPPHRPVLRNSLSWEAVRSAGMSLAQATHNSTARV